MTKLLILSDSHNSRLAIENILAAEADSIDALIFLGDGLRDLEQALTFYPSLRAYAVAGNCDFGAMYFCSTPAPAAGATPAPTPTAS